MEIHFLPEGNVCSHEFISCASLFQFQISLIDGTALSQTVILLKIIFQFQNVNHFFSA